MKIEFDKLDIKSIETDDSTQVMRRIDTNILQSMAYITKQKLSGMNGPFVMVEDMLVDLDEVIKFCDKILRID